MTPPAGLRPHRRAAAQLLLGYLPLLAAGLVLTLLLALQLAGARDPLTAATRAATATVVASGQAPDGRGVSVTLDDDGGQRAGVLVLRDPQDIPVGAHIAVRYDPSSPADDTEVHADGDAAHRAVGDALFGLFVFAVVLVAASAVTALRVLRIRRLRRAPASAAIGSRVVVRRGLVVRSWLELATDRGERWVPVHWSPELAALEPDSPVELRGGLRGRWVLPAVEGAELWPSGRVRTRAPRGERRTVVPEDADSPATWARQVRSDVVVVVAAPVLGLLWSYIDGSGTAGFVFATALAAVLLFWLTQLLGSDPSPPPR